MLETETVTQFRWDDLHRQNPPKIDQYLAPATDETPPHDTVPQEESTEKNSLADDSSGQGKVTTRSLKYK